MEYVVGINKRKEVIDNTVKNSKLNGMSLVGSVQLELLRTGGTLGELSADAKEALLKRTLEEALRQEVDQDLAKAGEFPLSNEESKELVERLPEFADPREVVQEKFWESVWESLEKMWRLMGPSEPDWDSDGDGIPDLPPELAPILR